MVVLAYMTLGSQLSLKLTNACTWKLFEQYNNQKPAPKSRQLWPKPAYTSRQPGAVSTRHCTSWPINLHENHGNPVPKIKAQGITPAQKLSLTDECRRAALARFWANFCLYRGGSARPRVRAPRTHRLFVCVRVRKIQTCLRAMNSCSCTYERT